jgi:hypothetical protein
MNACVQGCLAVPDQMLRLTVPDLESWRGVRRIFAL